MCEGRWFYHVPIVTSTRMKNRLKVVDGLSGFTKQALMGHGSVVLYEKDCVFQPFAVRAVMFRAKDVDDRRRHVSTTCVPMRHQPPNGDNGDGGTDAPPQTLLGPREWTRTAC